jgi:hypothetical protein
MAALVWETRRHAVRFATILCYCLVSAAFCAWPVLGVAQDRKTWSTKRYQVQIHMAFDAAANPGSISAEELQQQLDQKIRLHIYPLWNCEIVGQTGTSRQVLLQQIDNNEKLSELFSEGFDKHLFLAVRGTGSAWELACREHDKLTNRWTPVLTTEIKQDIVLPESCLELVCRTFSPLAMIRVNHDKTEQVYLDFMGAELPRQTDEELFIKPSAVFETMMLRRLRGASMSQQNLMSIPWTYVVAEEPVDFSWMARVFSGNRKPFAMSRRAGIEIIAIPLKEFLPDTRVRFHTSHQDSAGLSGYDVFSKQADAKQFLPLGVTDYTGSVLVPRGQSPITLLALRSESQLLAQVPVAPGTAESIDIPISDDAARLSVQASLTSFKELLVDTVARRNILIARIRDQLAKGKPQEAKKLFKQLDELPKRPTLSRQLDAIANNQAHKSPNKRVQAKIDRLIADSRELLGTFLSNNELLELETEIRNSADTEKVGATP